MDRFQVRLFCRFVTLCFTSPTSFFCIFCFFHKVAAFVAVVLSVTVTSLGWLDHVIPTVDDVYHDDQAAAPAPAH